MDAKIKPCPFCGCEPGIVQSGIHKNWIRCTRCKAKIGGTSESIFDAIERWNARIPTDAEAIRAEARAEALMGAKGAIKNDLDTFRACGRKDVKGHLRAIMLIDEIISDEQKEREAEHKACNGCKHFHEDFRPCADCERAFPRDPGKNDYYERADRDDLLYKSDVDDRGEG